MPQASAGKGVAQKSRLRHNDKISPAGGGIEGFIDFMPDKIAALQEMRCVLVRGGRLLLNVPGPAGQIFVRFPP